MANQLTLGVGINAAALQAAINNVVNKTYTIAGVQVNNRGIAQAQQALGRITGSASEFQKSMEAANARVVAFGASAGVIYVLKRAFDGLISSTIQVENSITEINSILNLSSRQISTFSSQLFSAANSVSVSFDDASKAAVEFARQGLGVEQTLRRTTDSLILAKISGMDFADSAAAITAALNSFSNELITSTDLVDRLTNADANFAVSSRDLAEAIKRVGSSASEANISLNETIALVTAAQQTTARGGSVIGNSFKTIFTRLSRGSVLDDLEAIGVKTRDASGNTLPLIQVLKNLSSTYDTLSSRQQSFVAEMVGGVYQINILKSTLRDLGSGASIFSQALSTLENSTGSAQARINQLNETISAKLIVTLNNLKEISSAIGSQTFAPVFKGGLDVLNTQLEAFKEFSGEGIGKRLADGILGGIKGALAGPGAFFAGFFATKLLGNFGRFVTDSVSSFVGLNSAAQQQAQIQNQIVQYLQRNPTLLGRINSGALTVAQAHQHILDTIRQENALLAYQTQQAGIIARMAYRSGVRVAPAPAPGAARGYIPNFSSGFIPNFSAAREAFSALAHGYTPGKIFSRRIYDGKGGSFNSFVNSAESIRDFRNSSGNMATLVTPPNGFGPDTTIASAAGFIPNFYKDEVSDIRILRAFLKIQKQIVKKGTYRGNLDESGKLPVYRGVTPWKSNMTNEDHFSDPIYARMGPTGYESGPLTQELHKKRLSSIVFDHQDAQHIYSNAVSTSIDKGIARDFGTSVGEKRLNPLRILGNEKEYEKLYRAFGEARVKSVIFRNTKALGGRGLGLNVNEILPDSNFTHEGEIAILSKGFIPNFAPVTGGRFYDFDETLVHYPENTHPRELYFPESVKKASLTPLGRSLVGKKNPINVLTAREINSRKAIENFLLNSGIKVNKVITSGSMFKRLGLNSAEKKAEFASRIHSRSQEPIELIDDAFANIKAFRDLNNESIKAKLYKMRGQRGLGQSFHANGFIPNFASSYLLKNLKQKIDLGIASQADIDLYNEMSSSTPSGMSFSGEKTFSNKFGKAVLATTGAGGYDISSVNIPPKMRGQGGSYDLYDQMFKFLRESGIKKVGGVLLGQGKGASQFPFATLKRRLQFGRGTTVELLNGKTVTLKSMEDLIKFSKSVSSKDIRAGLDVSTMVANGFIPNFASMQLTQFDPSTPQKYLKSGKVPYAAEEISSVRQFLKRLREKYPEMSGIRAFMTGGRSQEKRIERGSNFTGIDSAVSGMLNGKKFAFMIQTKAGDSKNVKEKDLKFEEGLSDLQKSNPEFLKDVDEFVNILSLSSRNKPAGFQNKLEMFGAGFVPNFTSENIIQRNKKGIDFEKKINMILSGKESHAGSDLLDFPYGGLLTSTPPDVKAKAHINSLSRYGDAKYSNAGTNIRDFIKKLVGSLDNQALGALVENIKKSTESKGVSLNRFLPATPSLLHSHVGVDKKKTAATRLSTVVNALARLQNNKLIKDADKKNFDKLLFLDYLDDSVYFDNDKSRYASGFIPNFADSMGIDPNSVNAALKREMSAGYSSSEVRVGFDKRLSKGIGVYNKSEGSLSNAINMHLASGKSMAELQTQGKSRGFIPNFAAETDTGITAIADVVLGSIAALRQNTEALKHQTRAQNLNTRITQIRDSGAGVKGSTLSGIERYAEGTGGIGQNIRALFGGGQDIRRLTVLQGHQNREVGRAATDAIQVRQSNAKQALNTQAMMAGPAVSAIAGAMDPGQGKAAMENFGNGVNLAAAAFSTLPGKLGLIAGGIALAGGAITSYIIAKNGSSQALKLEAEKMKENAANLSAASQSFLKLREVQDSFIANSSAKATALLTAQQEYSDALNKLPDAMRSEFQSAMLLANTKEEQAAVLAKLNLKYKNQLSLREDVASRAEKGESGSNIFKNILMGNFSNLFQQNSRGAFYTTAEEKERTKLKLEGSAATALNSVDQEKLFKALNENPNMSAANVKDTVKAFATNEEDKQLIEKLFANLDDQGKQWLANSFLKRARQDKTQKDIESQTKNQRDELARLKNAENLRVQMLREEASSLYQAAAAISTMGARLDALRKQAAVEAESQAFGSMAGAQKRTTGLQTAAVIDAEVSRRQGAAKAVSEFETKNASFISESLSKLREVPGQAQKDLTKQNPDQIAANDAIQKAMSQVDQSLMATDPKKYIDQLKAKAGEGKSDEVKREISSKLENSGIRGELEKNAQELRNNLKINEKNAEEQKKANLFLARIEQNSKAFGGIENFLDKSKAREDSREFRKSLRMAGSGSFDRAGRGGLKLIMAAQKDLGGALNEGQAGGLQEMAINARAAQIRREASKRIRQIQGSNLGFGQKQGLISAYQDVRGRSTEIAKQQVEEAAKLEKAPLEQLKKLDELSQQFQNLTNVLTTSGAVIKEINDPKFDPSNRAKDLTQAAQIKENQSNQKNPELEAKVKALEDRIAQLTKAAEQNNPKEPKQNGEITPLAIGGLIGAAILAYFTRGRIVGALSTAGAGAAGAAAVRGAGFIPNFSPLARAKRAEGANAVLDYDSGIGPFVRKSYQPSNLKTLIAKDHPEGLAAAISNSAMLQGVTGGGFIPNFNKLAALSKPQLFSAIRAAFLAGQAGIIPTDAQLKNMNLGQKAFHKFGQSTGSFLGKAFPVAGTAYSAYRAYNEDERISGRGRKERMLLAGLTGTTTTGSYFSPFLGINKGSDADKRLGIITSVLSGAWTGAAFGGLPGAIIGGIIGGGTEVYKILTGNDYEGKDEDEANIARMKERLAAAKSARAAKEQADFEKMDALRKDPRAIRGRIILETMANKSAYDAELKRINKEFPRWQVDEWLIEGTEEYNQQQEQVANRKGAMQKLQDQKLANANLVRAHARSYEDVRKLTSEEFKAEVDSANSVLKDAQRNDGSFNSELAKNFGKQTNNPDALMDSRNFGEHAVIFNMVKASKDKENNKSFNQVQNEYTKSINDAYNKRREAEQAQLNTEKKVNTPLNLSTQQESLRLAELEKEAKLRRILGTGAASYGEESTSKAAGFIPNFSPAREAFSALAHGYIPGKIFSRRIYDGKGSSFNSFVNSAESIRDFRNSSGNMATLVTPPNGFGPDTTIASAAGFIPNFQKLKDGLASGGEPTSLAASIESLSQAIAAFQASIDQDSPQDSTSQEVKQLGSFTLSFNFNDQSIGQVELKGSEEDFNQIKEQLLQAQRTLDTLIPRVATLETGRTTAPKV